MTEQNTDRTTPADVAEAVVHTKRTFSIVWVIPLVAALVGAWLAYKAISEEGPTITITFETAEGLEAGKTKVKYKDVEVGKVEAISISEDLSNVVVTAKLVKQAESYLTENTQFWVVRARLVAGEVSGLETIFSGAYIGVFPGKAGAPAEAFVGLEKPPIATMDLPGGHFLLRADRLGSLDFGSPVYFRQVKVGKVVDYELDEDGQTVDVRVFIHAPHDRRVHKNTRFWNAGGLDVSVGAGGIKINTESLVTLVLGGIAFETPTDLEPGGPAEEGDIFRLYKNHASIFEKTYAKKQYYVMYFGDSVRGLSRGAPVEFRGIKIGEVKDIKLKFDAEEMTFRIPVLVQIERERISGIDEVTIDKRGKGVGKLVDKGLRARLKTGNLLTGQLFVEMDFHPDAPVQKIVYDGKYPEFPTIPAPLQQLATSVTQFLNKLDRLPLEEVSRDLRDTIKTLDKTLKQTQRLVRHLDANVVPAADAALVQTQKTLAKAENLLSSDSPLHHELTRALGELARAARSIRVLADYLEQRPDALLRGKGGQRGN